MGCAGRISRTYFRLPPQMMQTTVARLPFCTAVACIRAIEQSGAQGTKGNGIGQSQPVGHRPLCRRR